MLFFCRSSEDRRRSIHARVILEDKISCNMGIPSIYSRLNKFQLFPTQKNNFSWIEHITNEELMCRPYEDQCFRSQVPLLHHHPTATKSFKKTPWLSCSFTNTMVCICISFFRFRYIYMLKISFAYVVISKIQWPSLEYHPDNHYIQISLNQHSSTSIPSFSTHP